jgi:hypothetical protein
VHPTHNIEVLDVTGSGIDYTVRMCTIKKNRAAGTRKAKKVHHLLALQSARVVVCLAHPFPGFPCRDGAGSGVPPAGARGTASQRSGRRTGQRGFRRAASLHCHEEAELPQTPSKGHPLSSISVDLHIENCCRERHTA